MPKWLLYALAVSLVAANANETATVVDVRFTRGAADNAVLVDGEPWLMLSSDTPLTYAGRVYNQSSHTLFLVSTSRSQCDSATSCGDTEAKYWQLGSYLKASSIYMTSDNVTSVEISIRKWHDRPNLALVSGKFLNDISNTASQSNRPLLSFPSFNMHDGKMETLGYSYFYGLWPIPKVSSNLTELDGRPVRKDGPFMFTNHQGTSLLLAPLSEPLNTVYSISRATGSRPTLDFGPSGSINAVAANYSYDIAIIGATGPSDAYNVYGNVLEQMALKPARVVKDPMLEKISYWTDNGAYLYYNDVGTRTLPLPGKMIPEIVNTLRNKSGFPFQQVQLDGWWMTGGSFEPSPLLFPNESWTEMRDQLGLNTTFLLYKAFFNEAFPLFSTLGITPVQSPAGPWYPPPKQAGKFYEALLGEGKDLGISGYEIDFMSDHWMPTPGISNTTDGLFQYLSGLNSAAAKLDLPVQFCMPTAGIVLASSRLGAVTNGRASVDYACEGPINMSTTWTANLEIGIASLLYNAVGVAPSKDVFLTVPDQPGLPQPQCGHNHTQPNYELDMVIAVLSTGPVGIGDGPHFTNFSLLDTCCRSDGTVLRGAKPLTAVDDTFKPVRVQSAPNTVGFLPPIGPECLTRTCSPKAYQSHTTIGNNIWRYLLSVDLGPYKPKLDDLYPAPKSVSGMHLLREFRWDACISGKSVNVDCATFFDDVHAMPDISSGSSLMDVNGAVSWRLFTIFPPVREFTNDTAGSPWYFMGEVGKIAAVSTARFPNVSVTGTCINWELQGEADEVVKVGAVTPSKIYQEISVSVGDCSAIDRETPACQICEKSTSDI